MTPAVQRAVVLLINAGRDMLGRFDRAPVTGDKPIRACRRMRFAIEEGEKVLREGGPKDGQN